MKDVRSPLKFSVEAISNGKYKLFCGRDGMHHGMWLLTLSDGDRNFESTVERIVTALNKEAVAAEGERRAAVEPSPRGPMLLVSDLKRLLMEEADILETWANDSQTGGWSTHQVEPMRRRAVQLRRRASVLPHA